MKVSLPLKLAKHHLSHNKLIYLRQLNPSVKLDRFFRLKKVTKVTKEYTRWTLT